jgi:hypothetical protein
MRGIMPDCERIPTCSYFRNVKKNLPSTVKLFKRHYCHSAFGECARHILFSFLSEEQYSVSDEIAMKISKIQPNLSPNDHKKVREAISS